MLSVLGSTAGGAVGSLAAQGATRLGAKALSKAGLQTNIFAKAVNEGFGGAAFSTGNAVTRSIVDPNYNPTADEMKRDAAVSFVFQTIASAVRLAGRTDQAKAALERDVAALKRDFETIAKAEMAGEITPTETIERMKIRSATLRVTIEGTRYIGQGKMVDDALAFLDQMDDFLAEATKHNAATMPDSGVDLDSSTAATEETELFTEQQNRDTIKIKDLEKTLQENVELDTAHIVERAKAGEVHSGVYQDAFSKSERQLKKSIASRVAQVEKHLKKIQTPELYDTGWATKSEMQKEGLLRKWKKDIQRNAEQAAIEIDAWKERFEK